jgi:hypothetical protein
MDNHPAAPSMMLPRVGLCPAVKEPQNLRLIERSLRNERCPDAQHRVCLAIQNAPGFA